MSLILLSPSANTNVKKIVIGV